ncbi:MAG: hypothetical protein K0Q95_2092 [Bacteroidota bacterium]|nr:hypothetical protein [Bacteroidota bacterium]
MSNNTMNLTPNEFEKLLCEFCKQDLPTHFTVEHDVKDVGGEGGGKRQIDTKIKGRLGVSQILICGEAKNWNSPVGIETIDGLVGKYQSGEIRANKVIVFSNNGYTEPAVTRAKLLGIELLEPTDLGKPIKTIPHIVGIGRLGQIRVKTIHSSPQHSIMAINVEDYIILRGSERMSFYQMIYRMLTTYLKKINNKTINTDLSTFRLAEKNILYELKFKEGYRYHADFEIEVDLNWDFFFEYLPTGVLKHLNTGEIKYVNLQGSPLEILQKVLLSPTKGNYEKKEDCIKEVVDKNIGHTFQLCMPDPDREKTHPQSPIFTLL